MKKLTLLSILILASLILFSQWELKYPIPLLPGFNSIFFIDENHGWASSGNGYIIHTQDGGNNWEVQCYDSLISFYSIHFGNSNSGWAVGNHGCLLHTQDGGQNWNSLSQFAGNNLIDVYSAGNDTCWVLVNSSIYFTENSGVDWQVQYTGSYSIRNFTFIDRLSGWTCGNNGTILKTSDAGNNWQLLPNADSARLEGICFLDSLTGYTLESSYPSDKMLKTIDGGFSWNTVYDENDLMNFSFQNADTGYVSNRYTLFTTTNGGNSWEEVFQFPSGGWYGYRGIFADFDKVWCSYGTMPVKIIKSDNMGESWIQQIPNGPTTNDLNTTEFINESTGWAAGNNGTLLLTIDGGNNWMTKSMGTDYNLNDIQFINEDKGWIIGDSGTILYTLDGGESWVYQDVPQNDNFTDVYFLDENNGWVISDSALLKTIDGGTNWETVDLSFDEDTNLEAVYFTTVTNGWLIVGGGFNSQLFYTTNGGLTWELSKDLNWSEGFTEINFTDADHGFFGGVLQYMPGSSGIIYKTQDGGQTWYDIIIGDYGGISAITFIDNYHGYIIGWMDDWGMPLLSESLDGGETWQYPSVNEMTILELNDVCFGNNEHAYIVGNEGLIMSWLDPAAYNEEEYFLNQTEINKFYIYPNPVNLITTLGGEFSENSKVNICIYNTCGICLKSWEFNTNNSNKSEFTLNLSNLPPGIYMLRCSYENKVFAKKLIKF